MPQLGAGTLSEIFADGARDAGAALGFCLMQARGLLTAERPAVIFLQMRAEAQETGLPYGPGLRGFGFDPDALVIVRTDTITEMLWAIEEAAGCRNVAAVIGDFARDHKPLDFTASRRLGMRAAAFGAALYRFALRHRTRGERGTFPLAHCRGTERARAFDPRAPGAARYRITLEKGARRARAGGARRDTSGRDFWVLKWTEDGLAADGAFPGEGGPARRFGNARPGKRSAGGTAPDGGGAALSGARCRTGRPTASERHDKKLANLKQPLVLYEKRDNAMRLVATDARHAPPGCTTARAFRMPAPSVRALWRARPITAF